MISLSTRAKAPYRDDLPSDAVSGDETYTRRVSATVAEYLINWPYQCEVSEQQQP